MARINYRRHRSSLLLLLLLLAVVAGAASRRADANDANVGDRMTRPSGLAGSSLTDRPDAWRYGRSDTLTDV